MYVLFGLIFPELTYWGPRPNLEKIEEKSFRVLNASSKARCTLHLRRNLAGTARPECNRKTCCFVHNSKVTYHFINVLFIVVIVAT